MGLRIIRCVAAAVALCAALVLPGASLASTSTATETLTVQSQLTQTGVRLRVRARWHDAHRTGNHRQRDQ